MNAIFELCANSLGSSVLNRLCIHAYLVLVCIFDLGDVVKNGFSQLLVVRLFVFPLTLIKCRPNLSWSTLFLHHLLFSWGWLNYRGSPHISVWIAHFTSEYLIKHNIVIRCLLLSLKGLGFTVVFFPVFLVSSFSYNLSKVVHLSFVDPYSIYNRAFNHFI